MQYNEFIKAVIDRGGAVDREQAQTVTHTVLADLGKRLQGGEAQDLAEQLPEELGQSIQQQITAEPVTDDVDDFLRRVAEHLGEGVDPDQARTHVQAVFASLASAISRGEIQDIRAQLPAGFGPLFEQ